MKKSFFLSIFINIFALFSPLGTLLSLSATTYEEACRIMKAENIVSGNFSQIRTIAANGRSLKSFGLFTVSSEKIIWETTRPVKNTVIITQGKITQIDSKGRKNEIEGSDNQIFELSSKMIASLLSGNRREFETYFEVSFESQPESEEWSMRLFPKDKTLSQGISHINLSGDAKVLKSMETVQKTGDSILYQFLNQRFHD